MVNELIEPVFIVKSKSLLLLKNTTSFSVYRNKSIE